MTIEELEDYFNSAQLPAQIELHKSTRITNVRKFIDSHLAVLRQNGERGPFGAFFDRLLQVKTIVGEQR